MVERRSPRAPAPRGDQTRVDSTGQAEHFGRQRRLRTGIERRQDGAAGIRHGSGFGLARRPRSQLREQAPEPLDVGSLRPGLGDEGGRRRSPQPVAGTLRLHEPAVLEPGEKLRRVGDPGRLRHPVRVDGRIGSAASGPRIRRSGSSSDSRSPSSRLGVVPPCGASEGRDRDLPTTDQRRGLNDSQGIADRPEVDVGRLALVPFEAPAEPPLEQRPGGLGTEALEGHRSPFAQDALLIDGEEERGRRAT